MGFQIYRESKTIFGKMLETRGEFDTMKEAEEHLTKSLKQAGFSIRAV